MKQKDWSLQSVWLGLGPSDSRFTVQNSSKWYWLSPHDLLGFCSFFFYFFFYFFPCPPPPMAYVTWWWWWWVGKCVVASPYIDSPLSRSPGSRVLMGVGLPITRASSPLGGPHRLEYWGTPPQSRSPPLDLPPLPLLLHWPMEWDCAAPIRFWLVPGLACQLVVLAPSDWPCAKKRFTSSSPANSARMVVFPSTHLAEETRGNWENEIWGL